MTLDSQPLPYIANKPDVVFFTDFDGTITQEDSNDYMTDNLGFGKQERLDRFDKILSGQQSFKDAFNEMLDSVTTSLDDCIAILLEHMSLDPGFKDFHDYARSHNIPVVILSSGMEPVIRALLTKFLGPDSIPADRAAFDVIANHVRYHPSLPGGWSIEYRDHSPHGHDKSATIKPYAQLPADQRPTLLYAGDGVSDMSAAAQTDLLFAKKGQPLVKYCRQEGLAYTPFEDWSTILETTKAIVEGRTTAAEVSKQSRAEGTE